MSRRLLFPSVCLFLFLNTTTALAEADGSRPMNVAVSPDGNTILATSMGSNSMTQAKWNGTDFGTPSYLSVGAPSWGVTFIDNLTAVVTHPGETSLSVLTRASVSNNFSKNRGIDFGGMFHYSTEIITNPSTSQVFIANRGLPLNGEESWTNAVFCVDIANDQLIGSFVTEREPRALVTHADRLFVGTVRGALGGTPLATNNSLANNRADDFIGDGGSILVYDLTDWNSNSPMEPLDGERIGVGSPVRGIAVSGNANNSYSVYYTSVGDEANSEDPEEATGPGLEFFGGRQIPNVINALYYSSSNVLEDTVSAVFGHHPDWNNGTPFFTGMTGGPAVLPDKIVVRDVTIGGYRTRELFVTNSGSGTLSRTPLDTDGKLQWSGTIDIPRVRLQRSSPEVITVVDEDVTYKILLPVTDGGTNVSHVDLSSDQTSPTPPKFTSNTRALAYDPVNDRIWVATNLDNQLIQVTATSNSTAISERLDIGAAVPTGQDRNFFGFGRGFVFRQSDPYDNHGGVGAAEVGTQTCGTCHVDGHTDGKVRLTKRVKTNKPHITDPSRKPVAVPSVFDVGKTEWIFFEGLKTIEDGDFLGNAQCTYCNQNGFFDNTQEFTGVLTSPPSPHGSVAGNRLRGRHLFEVMNCSRCHMGVPQSFLRTNEENMDSEEAKLGPLSDTNRLLNDLTQVFVSHAVDFSSGRNMTDVGTRLPGDGVANGINTPALAGAWDNRPYMHDGRYRTLDDVLANTWLNNDDLFRAAPLVLDPDVPDNALGGIMEDVETLPDVDGLHQFYTHRHGNPGSADPPASGTWTSVASKLTSTELADLKAFLLGLSSQNDPCSLGATAFIVNLAFKNGQVKCTSPVKIQCKFEWDGPTHGSNTTAWGTVHASSPPSGAEDGFYTVTVTPQVRPICGDGVAQIEVELGEAYTYSSDVPKVTEMAAGRPNPFNPTTTIAFSLAKTDHVSIVVYDAAGRVVRTLVDEQRKPARYSVVWDGSDDRGSPVASGVYFCRMIAGSYQSTQKLVLLK